MTLRQALAKLSTEDLERYRHDLWAYGNAMIKECDDGRVVHVPLKDWLPHLLSSARRQDEVPD